MSISWVVFPVAWPAKLLTLAKPTARVIGQIWRGRSRACKPYCPNGGGHHSFTVEETEHVTFIDLGCMGNKSNKTDVERFSQAHACKT